jgi:hypothetical protein
MKGWRGKPVAQGRLALLDRITLAPRQSLALVEAEGRRILVATSVESGPVFYPLDERNGAENRSQSGAGSKAQPAARRRGGSC